MSDYSEERYDPRFAQCGILSLEFDGRELTLKGSKKKTYRYPACSGTKVGGVITYSLEHQRMPDLGPIPEGAYWVRPDELRNNTIDCWFDEAFCASWGKYRIAVHPYTHTATYRRGGFFIHGGKVSGSGGCIDLTKHITPFIERLLQECVDAGYFMKLCHIPLRVWYRSGT